MIPENSMIAPSMAMKIGATKANSTMAAPSSPRGRAQEAADRRSPGPKEPNHVHGCSPSTVVAHSAMRRLLSWSAISTNACCSAVALGAWKYMSASVAQSSNRSWVPASGALPKVIV